MVVKSFFLLFNVFPFRFFIFFIISRSIHAWRNCQMVEFTNKSTENSRLNHDVSRESSCVMNGTSRWFRTIVHNYSTINLLLVTISLDQFSIGKKHIPISVLRHTTKKLACTQSRKLSDFSKVFERLQNVTFRFCLWVINPIFTGPRGLDFLFLFP